MTIIQSNDAPAAIGPYSQAIVANGMVFASGQIPLDAQSGELVEGGIKEQTEKVLENLRAVLLTAGSDLTHVIKTTCFLLDMNDFAAFNEVYSEFFATHKPARSTVAVVDLPRGAMVEIEAIAVVA
ncbi:MAG: RidA family protein [Oscillospiraceae bacterium]|nr:RidA family protein [Oscillospiraceae bacterium]